LGNPNQIFGYHELLVIGALESLPPYLATKVNGIYDSFGIKKPPKINPIFNYRKAIYCKCIRAK
jgi:hypothetical protein